MEPTNDQPGGTRGRRRGKCRPPSAASWRTFGRRSRCCAPSALNRSGSARFLELGVSKTAIAKIVKDSLPRLTPRSARRPRLRAGW